MANTIKDALEELPPRARRIHIHHRICDRFHGTTSACAENTPIYLAEYRAPGNYLRVRGEYYQLIIKNYNTMELPPRARRILYRDGDGTGPGGTTSACAENTLNGDCSADQTKNYLRVRGEYFGLGPNIVGVTELPPRARRIQRNHDMAGVRDGTTSACAENTHSPG